MQHAQPYRDIAVSRRLLGAIFAVEDGIAHALAKKIVASSSQHIN
jgi:hypothetical protein